MDGVFNRHFDGDVQCPECQAQNGFPMPHLLCPDRRYAHGAAGPLVHVEYGDRGYPVTQCDACGLDGLD